MSSVFGSSRRQVVSTDLLFLGGEEVGRNQKGREMRTNGHFTVCLEVYYTIAPSLALCVCCGMTAKRKCDLQCFGACK